MIEPHSKFMKGWSVILIILLLYTAIIMPYKIALSEDENEF